MQKSRLSWFLKLMLMLSLAFLYIPLVVLVIYSFNESKLVTVWGGFSTKWYSALLENDTILEAAWLSLRIAAASSLAAGRFGHAGRLRDGAHQTLPRQHLVCPV